MTAAVMVANQHLYARAEKEQSPRGCAGYQTLSYTHKGLTEDQVSIIEPRLFYYPTEQSPPKRVFFPLPGSGQLVTSNVVRLPTRDAHGRLIGLAHSLVFDPAAFLRAETTPFCVFDGFEFIATIDQALAAGECCRSDMPAAQVRSQYRPVAQAIALAETWPAQELRKLVFLILRADKLLQEEMALGIVGSPKEIEDVLRVAHLIVPAIRCGQCSFDTLFVDAHDNPCNLKSNYYWAVGFPERPTSDRFLLVDAPARQIEYEARWSPANAFERWLAEQLAEHRWQHIARHKDHAFAVSQLIEGVGADAPTLDNAPADLVAAVFAKKSDRVTIRTGICLARQLPRPLADRLAQPVSSGLPPQELYTSLRTEFPFSFLLETLYRTYAAAGFRKPDESEVKSLQQVLATDRHDLLSLVAATWAGEPEAQRKAVGRLTEEQYRQFLRIVLESRAAPPLSVMDPNRIGVFLEAIVAFAPQRVSLPALVKAVLNARAAGHLGAVAGLLRHEPLENLDRIEDLIGEKSGIPPAFRTALTEAEQQALSTLRLLARINRRLHGREPWHPR